MAKKQTPNLDTFQLFPPILLILYLCIGFIPNLQAVDKIAPQWIAMTGLNLASLLTFFFYRVKLSKVISPVLSSLLSLTYISFIAWAGLSYFYAINPTEVLVNITRQVNVLLMFLSMGILLYQMKQKRTFVSWFLTFILTAEIYAVLLEALEMVNTSGFISSGILKGVTANRNITAFSIAIKIPFVLYLIYTLKRRGFKLFLSALVFLALVSLSMIQSRASFVAIGLVLVSYTILHLYLYLKVQRKISQLLQIGFFVIPLFLAVVVNQTVIADKGADALSRAATISVSTDDGSINQRLRYYEDVLTHVKSNPILGTGLGNWKLKSIDYDSKDIVGYVVPYHAHSDFIQLGAELGIIGFLLYLGVFLWAVYYVYVLLRYAIFSLEEKVFLFLLLVALGVYSVDANLNFPIARPQVLVVWSALMALIVIYFQQYKAQIQKIKENKKVNLLFMVLALAVLLPSLYVTNSVYKSLKGQMFLLQDFNSNQFNVPLNQVETFVPNIPNITVTTIPINSVKARYYVNAKKYDKALALLDKGTSANPYLFYSEILKSQIFQEQGKLDSAKVYAKKAFFGLPNNDLHASRYINLINITRDKKALEEVFELLTYQNKENNWKNYLIIANSINIPNDPVLIDRAKKATEIFPDNGEIKNLYNQIAIGNDKLNESIFYSKTGLEYFNKGDYQNAAVEFEKAAEANPLDYAHFENAATANYMIDNLEKAEEQIDVVINDLNPLNGKCEYIKALIYIKMGDPIGACPYLATARDSGFSQAAGTFDQYCR
jgi:O-antigen ligase